MQRIAVPMIGGMISSTLLTLIVIPAIFALVKGIGLPSDDHGCHPPQVRAEVETKREPVTYLDNSRIIRLHFEHLHCDNGGAFCSGAGCLHQDYVTKGGQYRLIKSYYGRNDD